MPELLGPTNPVPGYESTQPVKINPPTPGDTSVQNIVDPDRVVRPDGQEQQQDTANLTGSTTRYESNFMTFLQRLRGSMDLSETFLQVLQWQGQVSSGIREGFAEELNEFLEFLNMNEGELTEFIQTQLQSGNRFTGPLFDALRSAYQANGQSDLLKGEIAQFLRRFSDFSATAHLEGKMSRELDEMSQALPSRWANQVTEILARFQNGVAAGDRGGNLNLLRQQLFPLISQYVSLTHDHGLARNLLSMLTLDVARYQNGSESGLLQSTRHLASLGVLPGDLARLSDNELLQLLKNTDYAKASQNNGFAERLSQMTDKALQGQGGVNAQEAFHQIMNAILINESVYMNLQHVMLPIDWNGELMFSEMWVDPDADRESRSPNDQEQRFRILIKMDVKSLGAFDLIFNTRGNAVSLQVNAPATVAEDGTKVTADLGEILRRNGLTVENLNVAPLRKSVMLSEVFPKLMRKAGGVNVKI